MKEFGLEKIIFFQNDSCENIYEYTRICSDYFTEDQWLLHRKLSFSEVLSEEGGGTRVRTHVSPLDPPMVKIKNL